MHFEIFTLHFVWEKKILLQLKKFQLNTFVPEKKVYFLNLEINFFSVPMQKKKNE